MREHRLGRKRILDSGIASVYSRHGVHAVLTGNVRDFRILEAFDILDIGKDPD